MRLVRCQPASEIGKVDSRDSILAMWVRQFDGSTNVSVLDAPKGHQMSVGVSHYPIAQAILGLMEEHCLSRVGLVKVLGYCDVDRGLRRLALWMDEGKGHQRILKQITAAYPQHADALEKAVVDTSKLKVAEAGALFLERCKAEESTFIPYIHVDGETTVPNGITICGITGGHSRWTTIEIPQTILALPIEDQLAAVPELTKEYKRKHNGAVPFFGTLRGFKLVRLVAYDQFDQDGVFVKHVERPFRTGYVEVCLR
jgi:hypothetical protein